MFGVEERNRVLAHILEVATSDRRVSGAAAVGGSAEEPADRWSDLDLAFAVADGVSLHDVLADWTADLAEHFDAAHLFDLPAHGAVYRVFLLPGCLQVDLSFMPAAEFGALGPRFRLLFGETVERPHPTPPQARDLLGLAVHHAVRARVAIERGRLWQAEYWIGAVRDCALSLACLRRGLEPSHGRGFDALPDDVLERARLALVGSIERAPLVRALAAAIEILCGEAGALESALERRLRELRA